MFDFTWLATCKKSVSKKTLGVLIDACKVDYCVTPAAETKLELVKQLVSECIKANADGDLVCDWEQMITGHTPRCAEENQVYKGCANSCDFVTCQQLVAGTTSCTPDGQNMDSCICNPGHYILNGNCVNETICRQSGWSDWSTWSQWADSENSRQKVRVCQGDAPECAAAKSDSKTQLRGEMIREIIMFNSHQLYKKLTCVLI